MSLIVMKQEVCAADAAVVVAAAAVAAAAAAVVVGGVAADAAAAAAAAAAAVAAAAAAAAAAVAFLCQESQPLDAVGAVNVQKETELNGMDRLKWKDCDKIWSQELVKVALATARPHDPAGQIFEICSPSGLR